MQYINNTEILTFINKAQNKIADLSSLLVERGGDEPNSLVLLLELSDFIECLDNEYNDWNEKDILRWIHEYNQRADLNAIPYLVITGYQTNIVIGSGGISLPITVADISDYVPATNTLIRATPHNELAEIQPSIDYQGYVEGERYHISKEMYDYIYNQMHPFTAPTVGFSITPTPNLSYFERGTSINTIILNGSYVLNSGESLVSYRYKRLGRTPSDIVNSGTTNLQPYTYRETVNQDTVFRFEATFNKGGTKTADQSISFVSPMYYGVDLKGRTAAQIQQLSKIVEGVSSPRDFMMTLPPNNTSVPSNQIKVPYLLLPKSRGAITKIEVATFNVLPDWTITPVTITLADGITTEDYYLCEFNNTVVNSYTFKVFWN